MGTSGVVVLSPPFAQDPRLQHGIEHLDVQELIPQLPVERFEVAVLPRAAGLDVEGLYPHAPKPLPDRPRRELRPIIRPEEAGRPTQDEELGQPPQHVIAGDPPRDVDGQALASELVDHGQEPEQTAVAGPGEQEVVAPDMVALGRPHAGESGKDIYADAPAFQATGDTGAIDTQDSPANGTAARSGASPSPSASPSTPPAPETPAVEPETGCNPDYPRLIGLQFPCAVPQAACSAPSAALWVEASEDWPGPGSPSMCSPAYCSTGQHVALPTLAKSQAEAYAQLVTWPCILVAETRRPGDTELMRCVRLRVSRREKDRGSQGTDSEPSHLGVE